ncbi:glycolate oxidase FAD binding subunit [Mesobacillus persicus]|uniref:Glycolate oxidase FAD binding subunit n=1 Tax=Mesobacillus persicus TaxID=930146 RepID=A0A1H7ZQC8_9BACI|nr:FAD-binding oxidoreductase [Mesobacillus persicus]SEM60054.1 glycolate oxidase FAD binding subunit [Mesobacillus persicus]
MVTAELLAELKAILPDVKVLTEDSNVTVYPHTEEEIAQIVKYCNEHTKTISIIGGGTKSGEGTLVETVDIRLSLAEYTGIVEHTVGDMTVTVKSGTRYTELQEYLAKHHQKVALDPSWPEFATIGGVIAANDSGPKRLGYGTARDCVIGLRTIYPNGKVIRSGGRVVKNVAGYDMNKLFIGSMGTLGVISEVTLKLRPLQKCESLLLVSFPSGNLDEVRVFATKLLDSMMEPIALELFNPALAAKLLNENAYTLAISLEDVESSVRYQEEFIKRLIPEHSNLTILDEDKAISFWKQVYTAGPKGGQRGSDIPSEKIAALKIGVVNLNILEVTRECQLISDSYSVKAEAHGGLGTGICQIVLRGSRDDVEQSIRQLREFAVKLGGYAIVKHLPDSLNGKVDVWGEKPSYFPLLEGIKVKMDPNRIMNPKRYIGGI